MINGSDPIIGPRGLTKNQLVQLVNAQYGGWPIRALTLHCFESADPKETVYRFVDERGIAIETKKFRRLEEPMWSLALTRDEYFLYHLSREAKESIAKVAKEGLLQRMRAAI